MQGRRGRCAAPGYLGLGEAGHQELLSPYLASVDRVGHTFVRLFYTPFAPFLGIRNPARQAYSAASLELQAHCSGNLHEDRPWLMASGTLMWHPVVSRPWTEHYACRNARPAGGLSVPL
jgi:hypothetical protein